MPELKGKQTEKNLLTAFAGESQARNRYTYFASQARKDGYVQMRRRPIKKRSMPKGFSSSSKAEKWK